MNKEDILAMEAGNELNVLVATKIFNRNLPTLDQMKEIAEEQWKVQPDCIHFFRGFDAWMKDGEFKWKYNEKDYSNDISAAWEVIDKMREQFDWVGIDTCQKTKYRCLIIDRIILDGDEVSGECFADTAPLAICKAALLAVMDS